MSPRSSGVMRVGGPVGFAMGIFEAEARKSVEGEEACCAESAAAEIRTATVPLARSDGEKEIIAIPLCAYYIPFITTWNSLFSREATRINGRCFSACQKGHASAGPVCLCCSEGCREKQEGAIRWRAPGHLASLPVSEATWCPNRQFQ